MSHLTLWGLNPLLRVTGGMAKNVIDICVVSELLFVFHCFFVHLMLWLFELTLRLVLVIRNGNKVWDVDFWWRVTCPESIRDDISVYVAFDSVLFTMNICILVNVNHRHSNTVFHMCVFFWGKCCLFFIVTFWTVLVIISNESETCTCHRSHRMSTIK